MTKPTHQPGYRSVGNRPTNGNRLTRQVTEVTEVTDFHGAARAAELADVMARLLTLISPEQPIRPSVPNVAENMPHRVLLTVEEAAERLGIGKTKAYSLVKSGALHSVLIGRLRRVHVDSINEYAARLVADQTAIRNTA